jgi:hypothetical protein
MLKMINFYKGKKNTIIIAIMMPAYLLATLAHGSIIFFESFDRNEDWTSLSDKPIKRWSAFRNGEAKWDLSTGYPGHHATIEILDENKEKAFGGRGKSFVTWRESYNPGWSQWNSDGILLKKFDRGFDEIYISFYISFSPNWSNEGSSKLFRVYSWDPEAKNHFKYFKEGDAGPALFAGYGVGKYGVRNAISFRSGPWGENYEMRSEDMEGLSRNLVGLGDLSLNFKDNAISDLPDLVNGGNISKRDNIPVTHEQVYGKYPNWTKLAFYVKINSSPGKNDGIMKQWINNKIVFSNSTIPWVKPNKRNLMVNWNVIAIGGNDLFQGYPNEAKHEEWYAIDELFVHDQIPQNLINNPLY